MADPAFALEEYKNCRQQILDDIKWMDHLEIYSVGAVAAVYVFMFAQTKPILVELLSFIPPLIVLAGALRTSALDKTIFVLNNYLEEIEKRESAIGYTGYYRDHRSFVMKASRYLVWGVLIVLTFGFQGLLYFVGPFWIERVQPCQF
jgi:hypothetical protein